MNWIANAFVAMVGMTPIFFATGIMERQYHIRSDVTAILWGGGIAATIAGWIVMNGRGSELVLGKPHLVILGLAVTIGALANICLFKSFAASPNPGLTVAIVDSNAVLALLLAAPLAALLPKYFVSYELRVQDIVGVVSVIVGISLISIRR